MTLADGIVPWYELDPSAVAGVEPTNPDGGLRRDGGQQIIACTDWRVTDAGILEGAMTDDDAERARAALRDVVFERVHTGHGFHFEAPRDFVASIDRLRARVDAVRQ